MRIVTITVLMSIGLLAQPKPPLSTPVDELNHNILKTCAHGERILAKVREKMVEKDELIKLVITLDYTLISELENRTPMEVRALKPARTCTKSLTARVIFYLKETKKIEKTWQ